MKGPWIDPNNPYFIGAGWQFGRICPICSHIEWVASRTNNPDICSACGKDGKGFRLCKAKLKYIPRRWLRKGYYVTEVLYVGPED
jgi:hypothetical protein